MNLINTNSLSFEDIRSDLIRYILSHKADDRWKSFQESSAGNIIVELIAGLGAYRSYYDLMAERESNLETAITPAAILEHAADRGLLLSPTNSGHIYVQIRVNADTKVLTGDQVGMLSDYELYAYEVFNIDSITELKNTPASNLIDIKTSSLFKNEVYVIDCIVGHMNIFEETVNGFGNFNEFDFFLKDEMAAIEFESLIVNEKSVPMQSDLNYLEANKGEFVLRRMLPREIRIYSGNGILGYADLAAKEFTYKVLSYGRDLQFKLDGSTPSIQINASLLAREVKSTPDYEIDIEKVRGIARYYPIDGRIVTDQDYMSAISKYFDGSIHDVYSYNSDPNQEIYLLMREDSTEGDIKEIKSLINSKRAMGMKINYYTVRASEGKHLTCNFKIYDGDYTASVVSFIQKYMDNKKFTFLRINKSLSTWDYAAELSNFLGITIKATKTIDQLEAIRSKRYEELTTMKNTISQLESQLRANIYDEDLIDQIKKLKEGYDYKYNYSEDIIDFEYMDFISEFIINIVPVSIEKF